MTIRKPTKVVVLGAGPAGLGAAHALRRRRVADVVVLERNARVGGNAGSFELAGLPVDYGSHRLHPACDPEILSDIRAMLGADLLDRPRHGRIRLLGRWIHFPLKPLDLALRLPPSFALGVAGDTARKLLPAERREVPESFATVLESKLGRTIARDFYLPYARKIWGLPPEELSAIQARRRVSADSPLKLVRKVLNAVPGLKTPGSGRFFYPRRGFGQISEAYHRAAIDAGARVVLGATVERIDLEDGTVRRVICRRDGRSEVHEADHVWSTIPISTLARSVAPTAPLPVRQASEAIEYRSMILVYLVLDKERYTEYDAHYFPESEFPVTRISEPKNYAARQEPRGRTVLCAELPCSKRDVEWSMDDRELGEVVRRCLERAGLPPVVATEVHTRRLGQAYPVYRQGYEEAFGRLDAWSQGIPNLLTFGRQGLFAHDNTHHALFMAYCAAGCLDTAGSFDIGRWAGYRRVFDTHVVED